MTLTELRAESDELLSEADWQAEVVSYLQQQGWLVMHTRTVELANGQFCTPLQGDPGYVDLTVARRGRVAFLELKSMTGRVDPDQVRWLNELAGVDMDKAQWNAKHETPPHAVYLDEGQWYQLVAVLRPCNRQWMFSEFCTMGAI